MATCLGISTENNLIKYAKITAEREEIKVNAFGIKFYDDLERVLKEIVEETDSQNIPICMNLTGEMYNYFSIFRLLNKKDAASVLSSEFELLCEEKGYSYNSLDSKYILAEDYTNKEKAKVIYISADKANLTADMQKLQVFRVGNLVALPVALTNLIKEEKENYAIINIEENTKITTVINNEITDVDVFEVGMKDVFDKIKEKENSIQKAYDICKNTIIYTMETSETQLVENAYLKDIMPVLYKIVGLVREKFESQLITVRKLYITGSAALINNIELYFQEYLPSYKCEILSPHFIDKYSKKTNIKDYIEVNSAIAVAVQGVTDRYKEANFKNNYLKNNFFNDLKMQLGMNLPSLSKGRSKGKSNNLHIPHVSLSGPIRSSEMNIIRLGVVGLLSMSVFAAGSIYLDTEISKKIVETDDVIKDTEEEIAVIESNISKVREKSLDYTNRIEKLENLTNQVVESNKYEKAIPILLNRIMSVIPREVKLTSIENTAEGKIVINAEAQNYDDLGYFKATLKTKNILTNVSSDSSVKLESVVKVTIEGELP